MYSGKNGKLKGVRKKLTNYSLFTSFNWRYHLGTNAMLMKLRIHLWNWNNRTIQAHLPSNVTIAQLEPLLLRAYELPADLPIVLWGVDAEEIPKNAIGDARNSILPKFYRLDLMNLTVEDMSLSCHWRLYIKNVIIRFIDDPADPLASESKTKYGISCTADTEGLFTLHARYNSGMLGLLITPMLVYPINPHFKVPPGLCGLLNPPAHLTGFACVGGPLGVCYLNTAIQCLYAIAPLVDYLETFNFDEKLRDYFLAEPRAWDVATVASNALHSVLEGNLYANYRPAHVVIPGNNLYYQQSTSENQHARTMIVLIRALLASTTEKSTEKLLDTMSTHFLPRALLIEDVELLTAALPSPLSKIITSLVCITTTCKTCKSCISEVSEQPYFYIPYHMVNMDPRPESIIEAFSLFAKDQDISFLCEKCGNDDCKRRFDFARLAPYVIAVRPDEGISNWDWNDDRFRILQPSIDLGPYYFFGSQQIQYDLVAFSTEIFYHCAAHRKVGRTWYVFNDPLILKECNFTEYLGDYRSSILVYKRADYKETQELEQTSVQETSARLDRLIETHLHFE